MRGYAGSCSCFKPCLPAMEMEPGMGLMTSQLEECAMEIPSLGLMSYFDEDYLSIYVSSPDEQLLASPVLPLPVASSAAELSRGEGRKRKIMEAHDVTGNGSFSENKNSSGDGKRARRGRATERSRRGRINERMRVLQDLVPGCHKSMGVAGMLDEIINYVRSLQNQVEFLSQTLSAACSGTLPLFVNAIASTGRQLQRHRATHYSAAAQTVRTVLSKRTGVISLEIISNLDDIKGQEPFH